MFENLKREKCAALILASEEGKRPSRGQRKHNRKLLAKWRRLNFVAQYNAALEERVVVKKVTTTSASTAPQATMPLVLPQHVASIYMLPTTAPPTPNQNSLPFIEAWEMNFRSKSSRGDCPGCGAFGAHPEHSFRVRGGNEVVKARQCRACTAKFVWEQPPAPDSKKLAPVYFEDLPESLDYSWHDCPVAGCGQRTVTRYAWVKDRSDRNMKAARCPNGHLFKPGFKTLDVEFVEG